MNLREYWRILKKRKFVVIVIAAVLGLFSSFFAILRAPEPLYTTASIIEFEQARTVEGVYGTTTQSSDSDEIETQISVIKSYSVFQKVAEKLRLIPPGAPKDDGQLKESMISPIESLQSKVEVTRERWTSILNIMVTDTSPVFAQKLANTITLTYKEVHAEDQMKRTKETLGYIAEQLAEVRERLRESEDEFNRFSQENELISIDLQSENLLARAQEIRDEIRKLQENKGELADIRPRLERFIENPSGSGHDFYSATANSQYQSACDTLVGLLLKRNTLLKDFTRKYPEVVAISNEIIENAQRMVILLKLQISAMDKKEIGLGKELEKVDRKTKVLMDKKLEFNRLKRKGELYNDMTALLEKKNQEALIRRAERPEEVKIVKPALLPTHPINPPKTVATGAMGVIIGLILGVVIGFIVETFDTSLGAIEDVEETLGTQVLGIIPHVDAKNTREGLKEESPEGTRVPDETRISYLISHFAPKSMMAESFRALRTNLQFKDVGKKIQTIAITSSFPQEGKTLVAINLALTMAQAGVKVLLVGCDLRKPFMDRAFGVEMTPGLTDILLGNCHWHDTVKTVMDMVMGKMTHTQIIKTPGLDNLHVVTSGPIPPNPAELIDSSALRDFIEEAKEEYDMILFDSSPILSTADAAILGTKVDGVLLVYRVGTVSRGLLKRSSAQLNQVECNTMGVILNGMRPEVSPDFQDYKYYYSYYSYGEEGKGKKSREHKRGLAFLRGKGDRREEEKALQEKPPKKLKIGRLALMLVAIAFLSAGILWQSGIIDPFKALDVQRLVKKGGLLPRPVLDTEAPKVKKGISKLAIPGKPETVSQKPKPTVSVGKPAVKGKVSVQKGTSETPIRKKSEAVSAKQKSAEKIVSYPYSIQLGAFRALGRAKKAVSLYSKKGLSPYWVEVELGNATWYRVYAGHFEGPEQAEKFRKEHRLGEALVKKTKHANLIDTYTSPDELEDKILSLKNLGLSPYVIKDHTGQSRLFVGTFVTKEGAEKQYHDLKVRGIQSQVVER